MTTDIHLSPQRVLFVVGLGTALSLIGDTSLYTVLPTHLTEAGITLAAVGILLSANRFIRLALNGPVGWLYDRWPRRPLFVAALFIGALSTALYALTQGFWPLLAGRLLWGLAWAGIWVGGNTIILDVTDERSRGHWVGLYQVSFFLGASSGSLLGGFLTDWLGYHRALGSGAALTLLGAVVALLFLPETRGVRHRDIPQPETPVSSAIVETPTAELASAMALLGVNRLLIAGLLLATFNRFLFEQIGEATYIGGFYVGVATLTGIAFGAQSLISMLSAPVMGRLSDRFGTRWPVAAGGLVPGVIGFGLLALGSPAAILSGLPLTAISGGSNQSLSTAIVGDLSGVEQRGRRLGWLFTLGDLTSAIAPPLAYSLIPRLGLPTVYLWSGGLYGLMLLVALGWAVRRAKPAPLPGQP